MTKKDIINLYGTNYYKNKKKIARLFILYPIIILFLLLVNAYKINKISELNVNIRNTKKELHSAKNKLNKVIIENISINKTIFVLQSIKFGQGLSLKFYINHMQNLISDIADYYAVSDLISINFSLPKNTKTETLSKVNIEMSFNAKSDEAVIKFIDALVTNLKGFIKVQEMDLIKNKKTEDTEAFIDSNNPIHCNLKLSWYIFLSDKDSYKYSYNKIANIQPKKAKIDIEDSFRLSVWEGSLMLKTEELKY